MGVRARFGHPRDWLLAAAALGLVLGLSWADDRYTCERFDSHASTAELDARAEALEQLADARCEDLACTTVRALPATDCVTKLELVAERRDRYGEVVGTFVATEGLRYSPLLGRWRVVERLDERQILGLPVY